jgi:hypothetical protein
MPLYTSGTSQCWENHTWMDVAAVVPLFAASQGHDPPSQLYPTFRKLTLSHSLLLPVASARRAHASWPRGDTLWASQTVQRLIPVAR